MARSKETYGKKEVRNRKENKKKEKENRRQAKKEGGKKGSLEEMMAYVDEYGRITSTPPDLQKKKEIKAEDIDIGAQNRNSISDADIQTTRVGHVIFYNSSKGYGFIRDVETKQEIFVHANNLLDEIIDGNKVTFELEKGKKGLAAHHVSLYKEQ